MKTAKGIVLRHINYSETSIIASVFTENEGMKSFLVKGARKPRAKIRKSLFQPLQELEIHYYPSKSDQGLSLISSVQITTIYDAISRDMIKTAINFFMAETSYKCLKQEPPSPLLYQFLKESCTFLNQTTQEQLSLYPQYFMVRLSGYLGFMPHLRENERGHYFDLQHGHFISFKPKHNWYLERETTNLLHQLMETGDEQLTLIKAPKEVRSQLLHQLVIYYQLHNEHFGNLKSLEVLHNVFQVI